MIPTLVSRSDDVDFIITSGLREALVLEKQLIRKHKPRYNSAFKTTSHTLHCYNRA